jgi:hypothetical protein
MITFGTICLHNLVLFLTIPMYLLLFNSGLVEAKCEVEA